MRPVFVDADMERQMDEQGYVVAPFFDANEAASLRSEVLERIPQGHGFQNALQEPDSAVRKEMHQFLQPLFEERLPKLLNGCSPWVSSCVIKWPGQDSEVPVHVDWTYVDDVRIRPLTLWVTLDHADEELANGPVRVVRGSHRVVDEWCGTHIPVWYFPYERELSDAAVPVATAAGQALIMDSRIVHCSDANLTDHPRVAVGCAVVPSDAVVYHPVGVDDALVGLVHADRDWFLNSTPQDLADHPPTGPFTAVVPKVRRSLDEALLASILQPR